MSAESEQERAAAAAVLVARRAQAAVEKYTQTLLNGATILEKAQEELSNKGIKKLTDGLKDFVASNNLLNQSQLDQIKDLRSLSAMMSKLEGTLAKAEAVEESRAEKIENATKKFIETEKRNEAIRKDRNANFVEAQTMHEKEMAFRKERVAYYLKKAGLDADEIEQLKVTVPLLQKQTKALAEQVKATDGHTKAIEGYTKSLKSQVAEVFAFGWGLKKVREGVMDAYEHMGSLTQKGLLGSFYAINTSVNRLKISAKEYEEIINKNRDLVNEYGGGVQGVMKFGRELNRATEGLEMLGKFAPATAARLMQTSKMFGLTNKNGVAYTKTMGLLQNQFKLFSGLYGDSAEEVAALLENQAAEVTFTQRLNVLNERGIALETESLIKRTEYLKLMGLTNQQIVEFNKKLEDMYDPRKNSQSKRISEAVQLNNMLELISNYARQNPDTFTKEQIDAFEKRKGVLKQSAQYHSIGAKAAQTELLTSDDGQEAIKALAAMKAAINSKISNNTSDQTLHFTNVPINNATLAAGDLSEIIDQHGLNAMTADRQKRNLGKDPKVREDALKNQAGIAAGGHDLSNEFALLTKAIEGTRMMFENPLSKALIGFGAMIGATILALGSLGAIARATGAALAAKGGVKGAVGKGIGKYGPGAIKGVGVGGALGLVAGVGLSVAGDMAAEAGHEKVGTALNIGSDAAQWAGAGALLGSVIPGVGTLAGGVVGGLGGAAYGAYKHFGAGSKQAPQISETSPSTSPKDEEASDIEKFMAMGWSKAQAAGIAANIKAESNGRPHAIGDGGKAYGLAQWHPDRQANFKALFGHDIRQSTRDEQLQFINYEMRHGTEKAAGKALLAATEAGEAGAIVSRKYERPAQADKDAAKRAIIARQLFNAPTSSNASTQLAAIPGTGQTGNAQLSSAYAGSSTKNQLTAVPGTVAPTTAAVTPEDKQAAVTEYLARQVILLDKIANNTSPKMAKTNAFKPDPTKISVS